MAIEEWNEYSQQERDKQIIKEAESKTRGLSPDVSGYDGEQPMLRGM